MGEKKAGGGNAPVEQDGDDTDSEFEEFDPSGRYGRYKEVLGKGAFKTVYRAFDELEGMEVAWNQVKVHDVLQSSDDLERLYSEVHLLKTLKHKNIIKFYTSWVDAENDNINIITEIFTSGTLRQYRKKHKHVDMRAVKNWSRQILRGLLYLHSHDPPIIHRDLKCDNIFVNGNQGEVKIGDLGLAAILCQAHAAHSVIGTPEFMAPELYEEEYNELVDIYSFGMCLLEMITFEYPYSECANAAQIYRKVTSGVKPAALDKVKDPEVREFVEKCLVNASSRLPARELLMDPFLQVKGSESIDHIPCPTPLHSVGDGLKQFTTILEELSHGNRILEPNSLPNLSESGNSKRVKDMKLTVDSNSRDGSHLHSELARGDNYQQSENYVEGEDISSVKEDGARLNRDFTVKGHIKDNTVFLSLKIVDSEGHVRNIHFPFDIDADTAMSVASEMVTELDLSDQDVTNIAAMIDAEILALVPEWQLGAAFEDIADEDMWISCHSSTIKDDASGIPSDTDSPYGEFVLERLPSGRRYWSDSPRSLPSDSYMKTALINRSFRTEGLMHSRFEELDCNQSVSSSGQSQCDQSNFSSQFVNHEDDGTNIDTSTSSPESTSRIKLQGNLSVIKKEKADSLINVVKSPLEAEVKVNMKINDNNQEGCEGTNQESRHSKDCRINIDMDQHVFACKDHDKTVFAESGETLPDNTDYLADLEVGDENSIAQKFAYLVLKQQEELEGLRHKHERAIQDFLKQLPHKGYNMDFLKNGLSLISNNNIYHISINASALKDRPSDDANCTSCTEIYNQKESFEGFDDPTSVIGKDMRHEAAGKDIDTETAKKDSTSGLTAQYEQNVKHAEYSLDKLVREIETKKLPFSNSIGTGELSSLGDSMPRTKTVCRETDTLTVDKCFKQDSTGAQFIMSNSVPKVSISNCTDGSHGVDKAAKRDSYIEFYKGISPRREKLSSSKWEVKSYGMDTAGISSSSSKSKSNDNVLDQLKKEQLQKSIADFQAKTLEGFKQSKGGHLISNSIKKHSGIVSQAAPVGSNAAGTRQQVTSETVKL